jgi:hypothetical protein
MGQKLVEKMLPALDKMQWPETTAATELGRQAYEVGLDKADQYVNDPKDLASALRTFQTGKSRPYAFAGAAYTLVKASREQNGSYTPAGLAEALTWLEKAQELDPDILEINVVEALIYIYSDRYACAGIWVIVTYATSNTIRLFRSIPRRYISPKRIHDCGTTSASLTGKWATMKRPNAVTNRQSN